jgi:predicted O-methyltransferase YrrM
MEDRETYIEGLYAGKAAIAKEEYVASSGALDFTPVVDDDVARFLALTVAAMRPARVLELGTSIGFSAATMATIARGYGGRISTIEFEPEVAEAARRNFERLGLAECIEILEGDARKILPSLEGPYDLIFQDVDKALYPELYDECARLLAPDGLLLADDTLFPILELDSRWESLKAPIDAFNRRLAADRRFASIVLPIGDGLTAALRLTA